MSTSSQTPLRRCSVPLASNKKGATVTAEEHIGELWKLSLEKPARPARRWDVTFEARVAQAPLASYEEVIQ